MTTPTQQTPNTQPEAFIPPSWMLIAALVTFLAAIGVAVTQPTFNVVGYGMLALTVLFLVAWAFMAPDQARAVITGRTARFGGTSLLVTAIFLIALIAIYVVIRNQSDWRWDLTQSNGFSLSDTTRTAITGLGVDPKMPKVRVLAFYDSTSASSRDRDTLLFEDYKKASNGKIEYEFVDPDRNPVIAKQYKVDGRNQIAVAALNDKGEPNVDQAQLVKFFSQDELTNAILRVAASGEFRAYFLKVADGLQLTDAGGNGMSRLNDGLTKTLNWKTQEVSTVELMAPSSKIKLREQGVDGEVIVIPGGSKPLTDDEVKFLGDFLDKGGSLVVFAAPSIVASDSASSGVASADSLAAADNLSNLLFTKFGLRFAKNIVLDPVSALQSPLNPAAVDFSGSSYVTNRFTSNRDFMVFQIPRSIETAPTLPADVNVDQLAKSTSESYAKTNVQEIIDNKLDKTDGDAKGPFILAASAENTKTGARVVLFGSSTLPTNVWAGSNVVNFIATFNSLVWTTRFNSFMQQVTVQSPTRPQDVPVFASDGTLRTINLVTLVLLPFGALGIGLLVWWNNRERARGR